LLGVDVKEGFIQKKNPKNSEYIYGRKRSEELSFGLLMRLGPAVGSEVEV